MVWFRFVSESRRPTSGELANCVTIVDGHVIRPARPHNLWIPWKWSACKTLKADQIIGCRPEHARNGESATRLVVEITERFQLRNYHDTISIYTVAQNISLCLTYQGGASWEGWWGPGGGLSWSSRSRPRLRGRCSWTPTCTRGGIA